MHRIAVKEDRWRWATQTVLFEDLDEVAIQCKFEHMGKPLLIVTADSEEHFTQQMEDLLSDIPHDEIRADVPVLSI